jgi:hypothetical protein
MTAASSIFIARVVGGRQDVMSPDRTVEFEECG